MCCAGYLNAFLLKRPWPSFRLWVGPLVERLFFRGHLVFCRQQQQDLYIFCININNIFKRKQKALWLVLDHINFFSLVFTGDSLRFDRGCSTRTRSTGPLGTGTNWFFFCKSKNNILLSNLFPRLWNSNANVFTGHVVASSISENLQQVAVVHHARRWAVTLPLPALHRYYGE